MRETANARTWAPPRPRLVILVFSLLVATNLFDAHATLRVVRAGFDEWNPIMAWALSIGPTFFIFVKTVGIAVLAGLIAAFARKFRWAWWALCFLAISYAMLLGLHVGLLLKFKPPLV